MSRLPKTLEQRHKDFWDFCFNLENAILGFEKTENMHERGAYVKSMLSTLRVLIVPDKKKKRPSLLEEMDSAHKLNPILTFNGLEGLPDTNPLSKDRTISLLDYLSEEKIILNRKTYSIQSFIKEYADQEGSHSDRELSLEIVHGNQFYINDQPIINHQVFAIAKSILSICSNVMNSLNVIFSKDDRTSILLVSVIVPTRNSSKFLDQCLLSIKNQSYQNIEIIVVDNNSTDDTKDIAKKYTDKVFNQGPERSAQTNFGATQAQGEYVYKVDSDFVLDSAVVAECIEKVQEGFDAVVVHNSPDIRVSWIAKIRKFEVDMYKYDITYSSARFVRKTVYEAIGGFNSKITAGEDFDFQNKLNRQGYKTGFVDAEALHLGEPTSIWRHMMKYYDYGKDFVHYKQENKEESKEQLGIIRPVYLRNWKKFLTHPILGLSFIVYSIFKFGFGGMGYLLHKLYK